MDSEKTEASDIAKSAELLLEKNTTGDVLFWVFEKKWSSKTLAATTVFRNCKTGIWDRPKFLLTLTNLQYNNTVSFNFLVTITLADGVTFCGARAHLKTIVISKIKRYYQ